MRFETHLTAFGILFHADFIVCHALLILRLTLLKKRFILFSFAADDISKSVTPFVWRCQSDLSEHCIHAKIYQIPIKNTHTGEDMSRPRRFTPQEVKQVAADRRSGMTLEQLKEKYNCAVNTIRTALAEYSDEFLPVRPTQRAELESQLKHAHSEIDKIKSALKKRFNLHV